MRHRLAARSCVLYSLCSLVLYCGSAYSQTTQANDVANSEAPVAKSTLAVVVLQSESLFRFDSHEMTPRGKKRVEELLGQLKRLKNVLSFRVIGHSDSSGPASYNLWLSQQRAKSVANILRPYFPTTNLIVLGAGEEQPVANNASNSGRTLNRRVQIEVIGTGDQGKFEQ